MISGYEIRENTVTPNSVFLLLLKADEAGCKEIEDKLSAFCKLTKLQMKGFDYVFELSGITDDSMLEKLRSKIDFISSSVVGVTQTFANPLQTETITLAATKNLPKVKEKTTENKKEYKASDIFSEDSTQKVSLPSLDSIPNEGMPSLKLAETGFPISQEKPATELKDLTYNHNLSNDEMTEIVLDDKSLKIEKTLSDIKQNVEEKSNEQNDDVQNDSVPTIAQPEKKVSEVEEENKTIVSFSPEEMKNVAISIEKPSSKSNIFGGFLGKFKSILKSKKVKSEEHVNQQQNISDEKTAPIKDIQENTDHQQIKQDEVETPKEKISLFKKAKGLKNKLGSSKLFKQAQEVAKEAAKELKKEVQKEIKEETQEEQKQETQKELPKNPFKDLGSGIIVKKGLLSEDNIEDTVKREKEDLYSNPIEAKLQVDDIFAAETVYNFYADQPETKSKNIDFEQNHTKEETLIPAKKTETEPKKPAPIQKQEEKDLPNKTEKQQENIPEINSDKEQKKTEISPVQETENIKNIFDKEAKTEDSTTLNAAEIESVFEEKEKQDTLSFLETKKDISSDKQQISEDKKETTKENVVKQKTETIKEGKESKEHNNQKNKEGFDTFMEAVKANGAGIITSGGKKEIVKEKVLPETNSQDKPVKDTSAKEEISSKTQQQILKKENNIMQEQNKEEKIEEQKRTLSNMMRKDFTSKKDISVKGEKIDHTLHIATPAKGTKYRNYPIEMPLIPTYTFANMDVSPMRFAHAMAMATLDNLGTTNNPFLLQGVGGTGKTHFLHAMGYEISKKIPQSKILFTNGVRLSRGIQYSLEQGQKEKLDNFFKNIQVLIIDDIHLTAVNEHNREYISKLLNDFLANKKQIILSSKYPPESLKRFEELVNFKFAMGTITELKVPNKNHFARLANKIVSGANIALTENQMQEFFYNRCESLGDVSRDVKRIKVLARRIESSDIKQISNEEILKIMTGTNGENEKSEIVKKNFEDITVLAKNSDDKWGNFGFFFPSSQIDKFRWVAFASQEAAKELGIKGGFNYALKSAYSTEHIISAAFKIANICDVKGLKGAVILGPSLMEVKEPIRDNFYDILTHMLEVMMIRCGTINFEDIKKPSAYVKLLGDILK